MHFSASVLTVALVGLAQAQTPSGFTPQANTKLEVIYNATMVSTAGQQLAKADTAAQPQLALSSSMTNMSSTYMFVMLDLDVPPANGSTTRRVLLHCMNTGFKATQQQLNGGVTLLVSPEKGPATYIPPGPPATDTIAHRYVELLFQQPCGLNVSASGFTDVQQRINFDITSFMSQNGVSAPLAANFFRVDGRASAGASMAATGTGAMPTGTGVMPTGTGAMPTSTLGSFQGVAGTIDLPYGLAGLLGGLAAFAM
ncbi:PEBP-like protein [Decorospora gaudefroyi]|uniref:PEBP-like protein n=1 Tax=Decorospora gaudefroyi TaxID=184978 RepID=A0A6A5K8I6_9PLEO|nr:PEBP-like protein [Decorospora gaudefroyi]